MTNSDKLREAIKKSGLKVEYIASAIGCSSSALRDKIVNRTEFKASEIYKLGLMLDISGAELESIFFAN